MRRESKVKRKDDDVERSDERIRRLVRELKKQEKGKAGSALKELREKVETELDLAQKRLVRERMHLSDSGAFIYNRISDARSLLLTGKTTKERTADSLTEKRHHPKGHKLA